MNGRVDRVHSFLTYSGWTEGDFPHQTEESKGEQYNLLRRFAVGSTVGVWVVFPAMAWWCSGRSPSVAPQLRSETLAWVTRLSCGEHNFVSGIPCKLKDSLDSIS